ncbi:MAG: HIT domain-containing protein [Candidatus Omnitrophica bacterium]|nr:HIT domain-containing protein [Candidatus Omnitrophota bacterium]
MDKLWAPWRAKYVSKIGKKSKGCLFCRLQKENKDKENFIFLRSCHAYAVLNLFPYNNGHVLVVPNRHVSDIAKLNEKETADTFSLLNKVNVLISGILKPQGFNIGINVGRVAGAGFPDHVHIHIVPRWKGDINFMPVTADTKVVSQSLEELYRLLVKCKQDK